MYSFTWKCIVNRGLSFSCPNHFQKKYDFWQIPNSLPFKPIVKSAVKSKWIAKETKIFCTIHSKYDRRSLFSNKKPFFIIKESRLDRKIVYYYSVSCDSLSRLIPDYLRNEISQGILRQGFLEAPGQCRLYWFRLMFLSMESER